MFWTQVAHSGFENQQTTCRFNFGVDSDPPVRSFDRRNASITQRAHKYNMQTTPAKRQMLAPPCVIVISFVRQ
eukprot:11163447-Lingulodinium_polyedra.AAC.1